MERKRVSKICGASPDKAYVKQASSQRQKDQTPSILWHPTQAAVRDILSIDDNGSASVHMSSQAVAAPDVRHHVNNPSAVVSYTIENDLDFCHNLAAQKNHVALLDGT